MAYRVFPSANDVGAAGGLRSKVATETLLHEWMLYSKRSTRDRYVTVSSGSLQVSQDTGSNLNIKVAVGWAILDGYYVHSSAIETLGPLPVNAAVHVYLTVAVDGGGLAQVSGTGVVWNTTGTVPTPFAIELAVIDTSGGTVANANIVDMREVDPRPTLGTYTGDQAVNRIITIGFTPSLVHISADSGNTGDSKKAIAMSSLYSGSSQYGIGTLTGSTPSIIGSWASSILNSARPEIVTRGFKISSDGSNISLNRGAVSGAVASVFRYLALP